MYIDIDIHGTKGDKLPQKYLDMVTHPAVFTAHITHAHIDVL